MVTAQLAEFAEQVTVEIDISIESVRATLSLFDEGATVPFIARYRKERTGSLDEEQIRLIRDRADYLQKLEERKQTVLRKIEEQGQLTEELRRAILTCRKRVELEDLYLPYKPKKRSRATTARERGLEPLAALIGQQPDEGTPEELATPFVAPEKDVADLDAALAGARDILAEAVSDRADVRADVRERLRKSELTAEAAKAQDLTKTKFKDYDGFREPVPQIKSHRYLAVCRGEAEKKLKVQFSLTTDELVEPIAGKVGLRPASPMADQLRTAVREGLNRLILPAAEREVRSELRERSEQAAIDVFASNLRDLLMAPPLGAVPVIGVDPGLRTGCKVASIDASGALTKHDNFPLALEGDKAEAGAKSVRTMAEELNARAVAVGTGTGGREALSALRGAFDAGGEVVVVPVSEAGASVYSASKLAKKELPGVDVTVRGAVSIARRLQDPLSELVKIDPRSIGVGQYQHDVDQKALRARLDDVVESCVNSVGVNLNTASPALLRYVAGVGPKLAERIVEHRGGKGNFTQRKDLLQVQGVGPKVFEQAAGFLRIPESDSPLDNSAVHPERYELVEQIAADLGAPLPQLVGNKELANSIDITKYLSVEVGEPTLRDIVAELSKPGRDPRSEFEQPTWRDDVRNIEDLKQDMEIEGVVTNVTDFGAFVDVGVHQDGLVHISQLAERYVSDPREVVRVGQRIKVRVLDVDLERTRISLSARPKGSEGRRGGKGEKGERRDGQRRGKSGRGPRDGRGQQRDDRGQQSGRVQQSGRGQSKGGRGGDKGGFGYTPFADILNKLSKK